MQRTLFSPENSLSYLAMFVSLLDFALMENRLILSKTRTCQRIFDVMMSLKIRYFSFSINFFRQILIIISADSIFSEMIFRSHQCSSSRSWCLSVDQRLFSCQPYSKQTSRVIVNFLKFENSNFVGSCRFWSKTDFQFIRMNHAIEEKLFFLDFIITQTEGLMCHRPRS